MQVKIIKIDPAMTIEESDQLEGKMIDVRMLKRPVINYDCDVYDTESGKCLAKFRKNVIPLNLCTSAYENLLPAATLTDSRATAGAGKGDNGKASTYRIRKDGSTSRQIVTTGAKINSGVAGYFDRSGRPGMQHCRLTAFTKNHFEKFVNALPIVKFVDSMYKKLMPKEYKLQRGIADNTAQDFVINDTAFTTVTVNKNYRTAIHKDSGDFKDGFGNLVALRVGQFEGCYLTLPRWGVGFDLQNGDLLLMDVHQWHGNTPMVKIDKNATRLSLVMYYREGMKHCGSAKQELNRVKNRKKGDPLNG